MCRMVLVVICELVGRGAPSAMDSFSTYERLAQVVYSGDLGLCARQFEAALIHAYSSPLENTQVLAGITSISR